MTTKTCKNCRFSKIIYRQFCYNMSYEKNDMRYCEFWKKLVSSDGFCENRKPKIKKYNLSLKRIDAVIADVKTIEKLLEKLNKRCD